MKSRLLLAFALVLLLSIVFTPIPSAIAAEPIVIGCPLSTAFVYGWDAERGITLAVEEINAAGGVNVGGQKRPFKAEVMDTRDLEPGVPVSEALLVVEKLILDGSEADAWPACSNGRDDDGDRLVDLADPGCASTNDDQEQDQAEPPHAGQLNVSRP